MVVDHKNKVNIYLKLIKDGKDIFLEVIQLSRDHKPNLESEKKRIEIFGGKVEKYIERGHKIGPYRVWKKNDNYPGLAMSRSIGDLVASSLGVIYDPGIEINDYF